MARQVFLLLVLLRNVTCFQYLTVWARETLPHKKALDTNLGKTLWKWCEDQVKNI